MLYTGMGNFAHNRNAIRDLTLHSGKGNTGLIGIRFNANNQGTILNVKIFSGDGEGVAGIENHDQVPTIRNLRSRNEVLDNAPHSREQTGRAAWVELCSP